MLNSFDELDLTRRTRIDALCREYEDAWYNDTVPSVSSFVGRVAPEDIDDCLRELLATDFELRLTEDQDIPIDEFVRQFPDHSDLIDRVYHEVLDATSGIAPQKTDSLIGTQIGDFQLLRELGRGGMGIVYEALQVSLQRHVALKVLPPGLHHDPARVARFAREARAVARLHHEHIVEVYGAGESDGTHFIAMQFIAGESLDRVLGKADLRREFCVSTFGSSGKNSQTTISRRALAPGLDRQQTSDPDACDAALQETQIEPISRRALAPDSIRQQTPEPDASAFRLMSQESNNREHGSAGASPSRTSAARTQSATEINFALELGTTLSDRHRTVARIGQQVAKALSYAHSQGVLHRDVKPSNILLDDRGSAWLTDFGLAKMAETNTALTESGNVIGTIKYLAPESLSGQTDQRSDVYSLGLTLYELLCGRAAFDAPDRAELLKQILNAEPQELTTLVPFAPRDLITIIHKAIEREPGERYQTAQDLADDLHRFLHDEPIRARPLSNLERFARWARRNKLLTTLLATLGSLVTLVAIGSTIAAGYFQSLSTTLKSTVGELTTATVNLNSAKDQAEKKSVENLKLAEEAEAARRAAQTTLADMQTERGLLALEKGDDRIAMHWFASAALQTPHDAQRQTANRLRAGAMLDRAILPIAFYPHDQGTSRRVSFQPGGSLLLLVWQQNSISIWDPLSETILPWTQELSLASDACWFGDGRRVAVGTEKELRIVEAATGSVLQRIPLPEPAMSIAVSADGQRVAVGSKVVRVWRLGETPVLEHEWPHPQDVWALTFSPSGRRLASTCGDQKVRLWMIGVQEPASALAFDPVPNPLDYVAGVLPVPVFFDDERCLVTIREGGTGLSWWDTATGKDVAPQSAQSSGRVVRIAASPDGRRLAVGRSNACDVWDGNGARQTLQHSHHVFVVGFHPDGKSVLTGCFDWKVRLWSLATGAMQQELPNLTPPYYCLFSTDGQLIAACDPQAVRVWKQPEDVPIRLAESGWPFQFAGILAPRPSFDGRWVTHGKWHLFPVASVPNEVLVIDVRNGQRAGPSFRVENVLDSTICSDNQTVAVLSQSKPTGRLSFFDFSSGQRTVPDIELPAVPLSVAARPNKPQVAVLCDDGSLQVFDSSNGERRLDLTHSDWGILDGYSSVCLRAVWSPDGATLVSVAPSCRLFVRDGETGELRFPPLPDVAKAGPFSVIDISSDSRLLAFGTTGNNVVRVIDLQSGEQLGVPLPHPHPGETWGLNAARFSPDGQRLLTANKDGNARLWDWRTGKLLSPPLAHSNELYDVAFLGEGQFCVTSERGDRVHFWDLTSGKRLLTPLQFPTLTTGNSFSVGPVAVVGDRVIVNAAEAPVMDVSRLLREPTMKTESLLLLSELATAQRLQHGAMHGLTNEEWRNAWKQHSERPHSTSATVDELARQLEATSDLAEQTLIAQRKVRSFDALSLLIKRLPDVPALHRQLANQLDERKQTDAAAEHRRRAIELFEQRLAVEPRDNTTARQLADLLWEVHTTRWHVLQPTKMQSQLGATLTLRDDGSIFASGKDESGDSYSLTATSPLERVTALRLEVIPDPSLPSGGSGRHSSGNFQLQTIQLFRQSGTNEPQPIRLTSAVASYKYPSPDIDVLFTLRDRPVNDHKVWHVWGRTSLPHYAVFAPAETIKLSSPQALLIKLIYHKYPGASVNLGRFRLSVTDTENALERDRVRLAIANQDLSDREALIATYRALGEPQKADRLTQP